MSKIVKSWSLNVLNEAPANWSLNVTNKGVINQDDIKEDELGYLKFTATIMSAGQMTYTLNELFPDGVPPELTALGSKVEIWIDEAEINNYQVYESFSLKPLTLGHPESQVQASNVNELSVGVLGNVHSEDNKLRTIVSVHSEDAKKSIIDKETQELSTGFIADLTLEDDERLYWRNIRGDHVALVSMGRCGKSCAIHYSLNSANSKGNKKMKTIKLGENTTVDIEDDATGTLVQNAVSEKDNTITTLTAKNEALESKSKKMQTEIDDLKENPDESKIEEMVTARNSVINKLPAGTETKGKSLSDLRIACINNAYPDMKTEGMQAQAIDAVLDTIDDVDQTAGSGQHFVKNNQSNGGDGQSHEESLYQKAYGNSKGDK